MGAFDGRTTTQAMLERLAELLDVDPVAATPLSGGDTARAFRVDLADGSTIFAKTHPTPPTSTFFDTEATGLRWLSDSGQVNVPRVLAVADSSEGRTGRDTRRDGRVGVLALEWIDNGVDTENNGSAGRRRSGAERSELREFEFGVSLARLHRSDRGFGAPIPGEERFGRPDARTTGSLALPNTPRATWAEMYAHNRLLPLVAIAAERRALPTQVLNEIRTIAARLDSFGAADEPAALLHGDLWAGNRLVGGGGRSWLIDPAAHWGHREFDLSMMLLFGGFGTECFDGYHATYPLVDGWRERVRLHQLAPLMVHAIKFGGSYRGATERAVAEVLGSL